MTQPLCGVSGKRNGRPGGEMWPDLLGLDYQGLKVCGSTDTVRKRRFRQKKRDGCLARMLSLWVGDTSLMKSRFGHPPFI